MIRTEQKILFVKIICQASFDISVFRYRYQSIVDKINSQKTLKSQKKIQIKQFCVFFQCKQRLVKMLIFLER